MKLKLGFSPCPNDTFIFDAMIHGKVDTEGLEFDVTLGDVEELNQKAFAEELNITKLSYHAMGYCLGNYSLLDAGSALGNNCGPLLIAPQAMSETEINAASIAIPGKYTTANFLLSLAYPNATRKMETLFSEIENDVLSSKVDAGLIIHENRFTYAEKGLVKLMDCGEYWEQTYNLPIPLGGIVVQKSLPQSIQEKVNRVMARSVRFALDNPQEPKEYVKQHAQEMEESVMYQHIGLYVNDFTADLGVEGRKAVETLFSVAREKGILPEFEGRIFVR